MINSADEGPTFRTHVTAFLAGLFAAFVLFCLSISGVGWFPIPLTILLASLGIVFGYLYPKTKWLVGAWLFLPYLILMVWITIGTFTYNVKWEGVFWHTEIFYSTIYLNACPVIAGLLGILFGSTRGFYFAFILTAIIVVAVGCEMYIRDHRYISRSSNGSIEVGNEGAQLKIDIDCKYTKYYDYRGFRYYGDGGCGGGVVNVITKDPRYSLPTNSTWVIDGLETAGTMWPINLPGGGSTISNFDKHAYDEVRKWKVTIPQSIRNAQQVELRWGDLTFRLQNDQLQSLKNLIIGFEQLCRT